MLNCSQPVQGTSYLQADYTIQCGTAEHRAHAIAAVAVLLLFCLGLPLGAFLRLAKERRLNERGGAKASLVFLTEGYKPRM